MEREARSVTPVVVARSLERVYRTHGTERIALTGVSFELQLAQTLAVVGESGAGKSTLSRLICGLESPSAGEVLVDGAPPMPHGGRPSPVQMVFQHPIEALNPLRSVGWSIGEPIHGDGRRARQRVRVLLEMVGIDPDRARQRPSAFSGGQLQRIVIARALASRPRVLVCDEPTSALDVSVQAQILNLLLKFQQEVGFACLLVTHDLAVAKVLADDVLVLRDGRQVELAPVDRFFASPSDAYSESLLHVATQQALLSRPPSLTPPGMRHVAAQRSPDQPAMDQLP
jgi:ABC-type glutathione transport system ATPase component